MKSAAYTLRESQALHEVGVAHHGWYMTEAEHRGVLGVLNELGTILDDRRPRVSRRSAGRWCRVASAASPPYTLREFGVLVAFTQWPWFVVLGLALWVWA